MTITERVAYIKGLAEGLKLDKETDNGKLLSAIIDVLEDMAFEVSDLGDEVAELGEQVDLIDEDLCDVEDFLDEECDDECCCDEDLYEVVCPECGETIYLDEDELADGEMECPVCGEHLDFEFDECDGCCSECDEKEDK